MKKKNVQKNDLPSPEITEEAFKLDAEDIFCDDPAVKAAFEAFGIKYFYPWQRLVVANILDAFGESRESKIHQIVLLPTGAGKSLCFQVPALILPGPSLIIYPLLALMSDQERRMKDGGLETVVFCGGQTLQEQEERIQKIKAGKVKIIIANPEILSSDRLLNSLCECNISHIAIDEAHCVSEWGDSFRPAYLELGRIIKKLNVPVVTAFTATASPEVLSRVAEVLFDGEAHVVRSESDRPNIHYYVRHVMDKKQAALLLAKTEERPMIIFCGTRRRTEDMCRELNFAYGENTSRFYHAGLEREEKKEIEKWFFDKKDAVLTATCAFGMGVDKSDIRTVVHLDAPQTAEAYIQEAGRGGRDRNVANAILLWDEEDDERTKEFAEGTRKAALRSFANTTECRRQVLLDALGAEQAVCAGCDICDRKNGIEEYMIPGTALPDNEAELLKLIKKHDRFFTVEEAEKAFIKKMNKKVISYTGVNIFEHAVFEKTYELLVKRKKLRVLGTGWKDRVGLVPEK